MKLATDVSCPSCGCEVQVVTVGQPVHGTQTSTVVRCETCGGADWQVMVRLLPVGRRASFLMRTRVS